MIVLVLLECALSVKCNRVLLLLLTRWVNKTKAVSTPSRRQALFDKLAASPSSSRISTPHHFSSQLNRSSPCQGKLSTNSTALHLPPFSIPLPPLLCFQSRPVSGVLSSSVCGGRYRPHHRGKIARYLFASGQQPRPQLSPTTPISIDIIASITAHLVIETSKGIAPSLLILPVDCSSNTSSPADREKHAKSHFNLLSSIACLFITLPI